MTVNTPGNQRGQACWMTPLYRPQRHVLALLCICAGFQAPPLAAEETLPLPLSGPAYLLADEAFMAYDQGNYATAISKSREVIRQRPDVIEPKRLLVLSLASAGELAAAAEAASGFIAAGDTDEELIALRDRIQEQILVQAEGTSSSPAPLPARPDPAYQAADRAYRAIAKGQPGPAVDLARKAVNLAPGKVSYRRLLIGALMGTDQPQAAAEEANRALERWPGNAELLALRGDAGQRQGDAAKALDDYATALKSPGLTATQAHDWRLALADAALAAHEPEVALTALTELTDLATARQAAPGYEINSRRGYVLLALNRPEEALTAFTTAQAQASHDTQRARMLAARLSTLIDLGRQEEAKREFNATLAEGSLDALPLADRANLAARLGEDRQALTFFTQAFTAEELDRDGLLNAAYVAKRLALNTQAIDLFAAALADSATASDPWNAQRRLEVRRDIAELSRTWGAYASLSYGGVGLMPNASLQPAATSSGGKVLQAGLELYWRPPRIGYRNGRIVELFGRVFETLSHTQDQNPVAAATGPQTLQGALGIRWKPFTDHNLVIEVGRLIKLGDQARDDWLLRAAISLGQGTDLRLEPPSWWQWQLYGEWVNYPETPQTLINFEARLGRSYRLNNRLDRLVVTPFLAVGGGYDDALETPQALGAGPGINFRLWFREDADHAPMSFLDANLQYRFKLAGDDRAEGIFASMMLAW